MNPEIPRRWLASLVVVAVLAVALPASAATGADGRGPFVDTDGRTHEMSVAALWAADVTAGCGEWRFCPDAPVTREEMAAFLARSLDLPGPDRTPFVDIAASPFAAEIGAIDAIGITHGCAADRFCPQGVVTRAQMASFVARALDLPDSPADPFTDDDASVHEGDIRRIAAAKVTMGCGDRLFCPDRPVTRAEMAAFLARAFDLPVPETLPVIPAEIFAESGIPPWPTGPGAEGWRTLVAEHFRPEDVDRAVRIMACESLGDPEARNPHSGASGLFQHMPRYWGERSAAAGYGGKSIFDPVANVAVAAWLIYDYPAGGWHHWVCRG